VAEAPASVDLATLGRTDWVHWGAAGADELDRKRTTTQMIDDFKAIGAEAPRSYPDGPVAYSWTGGTPTATGTRVTGGVMLGGRRNGFQLSIRASKNTTRRLRLYVGASNAHGTLAASLSDGSAPPYDDGSIKVQGAAVRTFVYTLTFRAGADGKALVVFWRSQSDAGSVTLESAALE
jgi:hypothetical protein